MNKGLRNVHRRESSPVAVGGVGGSGTRLIARILSELGYYIGSDLNESYDNLWFTLLFKHHGVLQSEEQFGALFEIFSKKMRTRNAISKKNFAFVRKMALLHNTERSQEWLDNRLKSLLHKDKNADPCLGWGWKEPNTHVFVDKIFRCLPQIRYIHVVRNGLDLSFNNNQKQLKFWGECFLDQNIEMSPKCSLKFWRTVNERIVRLVQSDKHHILIVNFDQLCKSSDAAISDLIEFLDIDVTSEMRHRLKDLVRVPRSIGAFRKHSLDQFDDDDIKFVEELGFDTE